ncbi:MAG: alpha/beta hydrolase [Bacteroidetes bacterium]|nr:MAG: alpha/beta hydrolase [Bacteroidota bacterium]
MYIYRLATWLLLLLPGHFFAQLTIQVTGIPANTPEPEPLFLVGNFNHWNPGDSTYMLTRQGPGRFSVTLNPAPGWLEYKFTRGGWNTVEGASTGGFVPNHTLDYSGQPTTIEVQIKGWEDLHPGGGGTAAPNVYIMGDDFYMPQLNRHRRVWVYLPPDYALTNKRYPVLYMHDGQNLFDAQTSSFGEWGIDETLNDLFNQGDYGCIIVGIDNGESKRLDEYSPWVNDEYGGGEGAKYLDFLVQTLKPHIDATYRTLPGPQTTAILGSSMGGLISMFAFSERRDIFGLAGVFSPAFWFAGDAPAENAVAHPKMQEARVYFLAGGDEPDYVETDIIKVGNALLSAGFMPQDIYFSVPPDGQHSEWFWRREFSKAYQWLLADAALKAGKSRAVRFDMDLQPGPAGSGVQVGGIAPKERIEIKILDNEGKVRRKGKQRGGTIRTAELPEGEYRIMVKKRGEEWQMGALPQTRE